MTTLQDEIIRSRASKLRIRPDELKYLINERGPYVGVPHLTSEEIQLLESYRNSRRGKSRDDRRHRSRGDKTRSDRSRGDRSRRYRGKSERQRQRQRERYIRERDIRDGKEDLLISLDQIDEFRNIPHEIKLEVAYQEWTGDLSVDIENSKQVLREYLQRTGLASEPVMAIGVGDTPVVVADPILEGAPILVPEHEPEPEPEPGAEPEPETKPEERDLVAEQMEGNTGWEGEIIAGETLESHLRRQRKKNKKNNKSCWCGSRPRMKKKQTRRRKSKPTNKRKPKQTKKYKRLR
tara:strand:- start:261 stop:1139 length:879 start_codon:yes stop_codon:yes gene_type:complete